MAKGRFVVYYPASIDSQGGAGVGIEAQQQIVTEYLRDGSGELLASFTEDECGKDFVERPQLEKAVRFCRTHDATLIIPQLDRLSRNAASLLGIEKQGYAFVSLPNSTVNWHELGAAALMAEQQRQQRSARIKAALAAAKARGVRVGGNPGNLKRQDVGRARGNAAQAARANARAAELAPVIAEIRAEGRHGLRKTARVLNERGITAPRGGQWSSQQVKCLLARIGPMGTNPLPAPDFSREGQMVLSANEPATSYRPPVTTTTGRHGDGKPI